MRTFVFILLVLSFAACRTSRTSTSSHSIINRTDIQIDTLVFTRPDSASIVALIRCDSLGNAYLSEITMLQTGRSVRPSLSVKNNLAYFDCKVDSMAVYMKLFRRFESVSDTTATVVTVYKDRQKGRFEKFIDSVFLLSIGSVIGTLVFLFLFRKKWWA
jgi:hypothetical protein